MENLNKVFYKYDIIKENFNSDISDLIYKNLSESKTIKQVYNSVNKFYRSINVEFPITIKNICDFSDLIEQAKIPQIPSDWSIKIYDLNKSGFHWKFRDYNNSPLSNTSDFTCCFKKNRMNIQDLLYNNNFKYVIISDDENNMIARCWLYYETRKQGKREVAIFNRYSPVPNLDLLSIAHRLSKLLKLKYYKKVEGSNNGYDDNALYINSGSVVMLSDEKYIDDDYDFNIDEPEYIETIHGQDIDEEESYYSEYLDGYIHRDDVYEVYDLSQGEYVYLCSCCSSDHFDIYEHEGESVGIPN